MLNNKVGAENVTKKVGDGSKTLFWHESWLGDEVLKNCFSRLFNLALEKSVFVADMVLGIGVEWGWWRWRRNLFIWEYELVEECKVLLFNISLLDDMEDTWIWEFNLDGVYSVKEVDVLISNFWRCSKLSTLLYIRSFGIVWFFWRFWCSLGDYYITVFLSKTIYIKERCKVLFSCVAECNMIETTNNVSFDCLISGKLWMNVLSWLGISRVMTNICSCHVVQFVGLVSQGKKVKECFHAIWLTCIWTI